MKNLKLGIFSLLAIFAVSVFLTSCEQDTLNEVDITDEVNLIDEVNSEPMNLFLNDLAIESATDDSMIEYIESLSPTEITKSKNDYIVAEYLVANDLLDEVLLKTKHLSELDLSTYLSQSKIDELHSRFQEVEELEARGCRYININYPCWRTCKKWGVKYPCIKTCTRRIVICT